MSDTEILNWIEANCVVTRRVDDIKGLHELLNRLPLRDVIESMANRDDMPEPEVVQK